MKKLSFLVGAIFLIQGAAGLVHEWIGWFRFWVVVHYLDFLAGHEILANAVLVIVGFLLLFLGYEEKPQQKQSE